MFPPSYCSRAALSSFSNSPRSCPYMGSRVPGNPSLFPKGTPSYLVFLTSAQRSHPQGGPPRPADPKQAPGSSCSLLIPPGAPESAIIQCHSLVSPFTPCLLHVPHPLDECSFSHSAQSRDLNTGSANHSSFSFLIPSTPLQHQGSDGGSRTTPLWSPS